MSLLTRFIIIITIIVSIVDVAVFYAVMKHPEIHLRLLHEEALFIF